MCMPLTLKKEWRKLDMKLIQNECEAVEDQLIAAKDMHIEK